MTNPLLSSALSCPRPTKKARHDDDDDDDNGPQQRRRSSGGSNNRNRKAGGDDGEEMDTGEGKICFIGDSFIRKFGLMKHSRIEVQGFKGATAKGLARTDNSNRKQIVQTIKSRNIDRVVFNFGNVDVHLSYYYKLYGQAKETIDLTKIANDYVDVIASLFPSSETGATSNPKVIIVGVYPSAPEDQHVAASLVSYGSLTQEEADKIPTKDTLQSVRRSRVDEFNNAIKAKCSLLSNIEYEDAISEMTDPKTGQILEAFRDISDHNIHVVWETTILLWMKRWPWYATLAPSGFEDDLQHTLGKYLKTKPWAERKHVTENRNSNHNGRGRGRFNRVGSIQAAVDNSRDNNSINSGGRGRDWDRGGRNATNDHHHNHHRSHNWRNNNNNHNGSNSRSYSNRNNNNNNNGRRSSSSSWKGGEERRSSWSPGEKQKRFNNNRRGEGAGGNGNDNNLYRPLNSRR